MITFSGDSPNARVQSVSILTASLDPLAYPILFPYGDKGWNVNMVHIVASTSTARTPRNATVFMLWTCS